jgi:hypothetical protein
MSKFMLKNVRCSFLVLGEPEDYQGNKKFRWSATALVPYGSELAKQVEAAIKEMAIEKWEKKGAAVFENCMADPKGTCWIDGKRKEYEGYEGHMALTAHRYKDKGRPLVMDKDTSPVYRDDNELYEGKGGKIYSGCYVNMQVEFWGQDNSNGKGLRATLMGIQKVRDGDAFGGGSAPTADDFEAIEEGADADDLV